MLALQCKTSPKWVHAALAHLDDVLVDHAHCEMKAASNALSLATRLFAHPQLVRTLSTLAEEELGHFRRVIEEVERRNIAFGPPAVDHYAGELLKRVKASQPRSDWQARLVDRLLVSAAIEARSCERLKLLADHLDDVVLAAFYQELFVAEARHFSVFVDIATTVGAKVPVAQRLAEVMQIEATVVEQLGSLPTIHG